ncbi:uncharacterized protein [Clytia hemisphaerica]|uniref:Uncharacterized protein n=1 Tax=Clytia hemisphaerica TaxID=252671 RepID=A0A7M5X639_9CNID
MSLNEIQLRRDQYGKLPFLTNWSRHEVAAMERSWHTDHWCKTKHKRMTFFTTDQKKTTNFYPGGFMNHELKSKKEGEDSITPHHCIDTGTMKHIGTISFTQMLHQDLNGKLPGLTSKRNPSKKLLKTKANTRAKEGFEFWFKDPEPMKHKNKKWIGQGGNVMGTMSK